MTRRIVTALVVALGAAALVYTFYVNAWVVDDAYITFRTVDNFVAGRGLTWNPGERVQVFTHPLWMLALSAAYAVTRELFYTSIALSFVCCAAAVSIVSWRLRDERALVFIAAVLAGKAIIDFSSSGLESPLSYLIAAAFWTTLLREERAADGVSRRTSAALYAAASLAFVNRLDTILLYAPALAAIAWQSAKTDRRRLAYLALASLAAVAWLAFATFYFGFPFPNTYYAKVATG